MDFEQPASCWNSNFKPYFSISVSEKRGVQQKSINQTLFPVESTPLDPMMKSDLVTSGDGTVKNLILLNLMFKTLFNSRIFKN